MTTTTVDPTTIPDPSTPTITVPVTPVAAPPPAANFSEEDLIRSPAVQALIEQVRKQEKDKLYPQIEDLKKSVKEINDERDAKIAEASKAAREEQAAKDAKKFEESDAKTLLKEAEQTWEQKFARMSEERATERAAFEKEKQFLELSQYAQSAVQKAVDANEIAPELAHMVTGNNVDEVNASLENVKATSAALVASFQQTLQQAATQRRGVSPTGYAPVGPMEAADGTRTLTPADIQNMSMSEYAKLRSQLGVNQANASRGIFG